MFLRSLVFSFLLLFALPLFSDELIIEPEMGIKPLLNAIQSTQHSLDLVMYGFTDQSLLNAILQKKKEDKAIKIILEAKPYKSESENNKVIAAFNQQDIAWQGQLPFFRLIHQKTLILDNDKAIIMTFNFTHSTFKNERNVGLVIDNPKRVKAIQTIFDADWNHVQAINTDADIILSPNDSRDKLLTLIQKAKHSIRIYAQNISDYKMILALENAARRSVNVEIITSNENVKLSQVHVYYNKKFIIHAKILMIDNKIAVIGSINLTRASLDNNRELSVITRDANVIAELNALFDQDSNPNAT